MVDLGGQLGRALGTLVGGSLSGGGDNPLGSLLRILGGGDEAQEKSLLATVLELVLGIGGLSGVLEIFRKHGFGQQAESWVSDRPNEEVQPEQISQVLGDSAVRQIASKLGIDAGEASSVLAKLLPEVVNQITPRGTVSGEQDDLVSKGLSLLKGAGLF